MAPFPRSELKHQDSTVLMTFKECARKYFYMYVLGYKRENNPPYFTLGTVYHKFRELLEVEYKLAEDKKDLSMVIMKAYLPSIALWDKIYKAPPLDDKFFWLNKDILIADLNVAIEHWKHEKAVNTYQILAVEQPFTLEVSPGIYRTGRADVIVKWMGKIWGKDYKTSTSQPQYYPNTLDPNDQFDGYTWGESVLQYGEFSERKRVAGQIVECLFNTKPNKDGKIKPPVIKTFTANRNLYQIQTWIKELADWNDFLQRCRDRDSWPMNQKSCKYCEFRPVCTASSESAQMSELKRNYTIKLWNPADLHAND